MRLLLIYALSVAPFACGPCFANDAEKPPRTFSGVCRAYLEILNPVAAARELYADGEFDFILHPLRAVLTSDRAYVARDSAEYNERQLKYEAELAAAQPPRRAPPRADEAQNRATAARFDEEYHVVINRSRLFFTRDDGLRSFDRGWALFFDRHTRLVVDMVGPAGERTPP